MRRLIQFALPLPLLALLAACTPAPPPVTLLVHTTPMHREERAAFAWLQAQPQVEARLARFDETVRLDEQSGPLWLHVVDSVAWVGWQAESERLASLLQQARQAGRPLLLTGFAAELPFAMGVEAVAPTRERELLPGGGCAFDQIRGLQSFRGHPLFAGLQGGAFLYDSGQPDTLWTTGHLGRWPEQGRVVAVEKRYMSIDSERRTLLEYGPDSSGARLIACGAALRLDGPNLQRPQLEHFLANCLHRLVEGGGDMPESYWTPDQQPPNPDLAPSGGSAAPLTPSGP